MAAMVIINILTLLFLLNYYTQNLFINTIIIIIIIVTPLVSVTIMHVTTLFSLYSSQIDLF